MDELLVEFLPAIKEDYQGFQESENKNFPPNFTEEEKVKKEYMRIHSYFHDKQSNESVFDSNQSFVIQETLTNIKMLIEQEQYLAAKYFIVSLQLVLDMQVKLTGIIINMIRDFNQVSEFIDINRFYGKGGEPPVTRKK